MVERQSQEPTIQEAVTPISANVNRHPLQNTSVHIPTNEEVMEELHQTTLQYLSCIDPTEAAARRQRVLQGDSQGQMEQVAAGIIEAATRAAEITVHQNAVRSEENLPHQNDEASSIIGDQTTRSPEQEIRSSGLHSYAAFLRSPIENLPTNGALRNPPTDAVIPQGQKRKRTTPARLRSAIVSPKHPQGASSKKRLRALIRTSPGGATRSSGRDGTKRHTPDRNSDVVGPSRSSNQPRTNVFPASTKRSSDFHAPPRPAP